MGLFGFPFFCQKTGLPPKKRYNPVKTGRLVTLFCAPNFILDTSNYAIVWLFK
jgi:hypothetical protein